MSVEDEGITREIVVGGGFNKGTEKEGIRVRNGEDELAGIENCVTGAGGCEEFGEKREVGGFAGGDDLGVDLLQRFNPAAGEEEELVERQAAAGVVVVVKHSIFVNYNQSCFPVGFSVQTSNHKPSHEIPIAVG
ncbi:hypothetical protein R6Q59_032634 [Mikania micrantha]